MAINNVSLTSGMRANLASLQGTMELLNRTQERLSTGKKVNTALDSPISFFTAAALNTRAGDIGILKDSMNEAIQTIKAADSGITSLTGLIDSAKALATSALGASKNQVRVSLSALTAGTVITIGGTKFGAVATSVTSVGATQFKISGDAATDAANLAALINSTKEATTGVSATVSGSTLVLTATSNSVSVTLASTLTTDAAGYVVQSDTNGKKVFSERANLAASYNNIMTQIDALANTSGYKGVNLLMKQDLNVNFEGSALTVKGFSATASDLKLATKASTSVSKSVDYAWSVNSEISSDLGKIDNAYTTLRAQASALSSNNSIINVQLSFATNMVNTLTEGADKLTLADMSEEGANMLMLQTRQSLGTTALSLSSQAAQAVLRLFG